jgi:uncharacterized membrane protein
MKYFEQTLATSRSTFATSICNTCNIPLKHVKHKTYICNMRFFLSWCLRPTVGDDVLAGDDLHLMAQGGGGAVHVMAAQAGAEWHMAVDGHGNEMHWGGAVVGEVE